MAFCYFLKKRNKNINSFITRSFLITPLIYSQGFGCGGSHKVYCQRFLHLSRTLLLPRRCDQPLDYRPTGVPVFDEYLEELFGNPHSPHVSGTAPTRKEGCLVHEATLVRDLLQRVKSELPILKDILLSNKPPHEKKNPPFLKSEKDDGKQIKKNFESVLNVTEKKMLKSSSLSNDGVDVGLRDNVKVSSNSIDNDKNNLLSKKSSFNFKDEEEFKETSDYEKNILCFEYYDFIEKPLTKYASPRPKSTSLSRVILHVNIDDIVRVENLSESQVHLLRLITSEHRDHEAEVMLESALANKAGTGSFDGYIADFNKLSIPRAYNPISNTIRISCSRYPFRAQNKRWLGDTFFRILNHIKNTDDFFEDLKPDLKYADIFLQHREKSILFLNDSVPNEWKLTKKDEIKQENILNENST